MTRTLVGTDTWLAAMRADGSAFQAAVAGTAPDTPVPSCPGWTIAGLAAHLGGLYDWVADHVGRGVTERPVRWQPEFAPQEDTDIVPWWDERFEHLLTLLDLLDPQLPAWNWAPRAKTVAFWSRRMAHETSIHRWDAQFAVARAEPLEPRLAADGVSEVLDSWLPAGLGSGPRDVRGIVALHATDTQQEWHVRLRGDGAMALLDTDTLLDSDDHRERTVVCGSASDLLLALYGRIDSDILHIAGDERLFHALRTG